MNTRPGANVIASQVENPARAAILSVLDCGRALTPRELARATGATLESARSHLSSLERIGLVTLRRQGPHRYFQIASDAIARELAAVLGSAARHQSARVVTGPKDPALRQARVCYGHLAGPRAVRLFDTFSKRGVVISDGDALRLTEAGETFVGDFGVDLAALRTVRKPMSKTCLDWTERRSHLAGPLGSALLGRIIALGWATRDPNSRLVTFSKSGEAAFDTLFAA